MRSRPGRLESAVHQLEEQSYATQRSFASGWNNFVSMLMVPTAPRGDEAPAAADAAAGSEDPVLQSPPPSPTKKKKQKQQRKIETHMDGDDEPRQQRGPDRPHAAEGYRFETYGVAEDDAAPEAVAIDTVYSRQDYQRRESVRKSLRQMEEYQESLPTGNPVLESTPVLAFCQLARIYQLTQGCFLTVFVTQKCPNVVDPTVITSSFIDYVTVWKNNNVCDDPWLPPGHLCSIEETLDWENMGTHTKVVFVINCITFAFCVAVELFLWVRERWVRTLFVEDKRKPYALIQVQLQQQHELFAEFQRLRRKPEPEAGEPPDADVLDTVAKVDSLAHALTWGVLLLCSANLIVSSQYLLAANRRWTYRTILHLLANTLLIVWDVMNLFRVTARGPRTQNLALSMLVKEPISFNVYKAPKPESDDDGHGDGA